MPKIKELYIKKILFSKFFLLAGILLLILFSSALGKEFITHYHIKKEIDSLKEDVNTLENKERELNSLITYYESEDFIKKEARVKLNLKEKGESVLIIPGIDEKIEENDQSNKNNKMSKQFADNINRWLDYFKNRYE